MRSLVAELPREKNWERWLLGAVIVVFSVLAFLEVWKWRPGFAQTDETEALMYLQQWREGVPLEIEIFKGTLQRHAAAAMLWIFGPSMMALRVLTWSTLALEIWLLARVAAALLGRRAALWAIMACLICGSTFLRARSLLAFAATPAELLALMILLGRVESRLGSFLFGGVCAFLLADYEGWLLALPVLALAWFSQEGNAGRRSVWAFAGFSLVLALLLIPSLTMFSEHVLQRKRNLAGVPSLPLEAAIRGAKGFFIGSPQTTGHLGLLNHSMLGTWSLPLLIFGVWGLRKRGWFLILWAGIGLLPLLSNGGSGEPNRIVAAWPALFMIAGYGASAFLEWGGSPAAMAGILLALGGAYGEARAYSESMAKVAPTQYAPSENMLRLAAAHPRSRPVLEFAYKSSAPWRFFWESLRQPATAGEIYVLNWEMLPALLTEKTNMSQRPEAVMPADFFWFSEASDEFKKRLRAADNTLRQLHNHLPRYGKRARRDALLNVLMYRPDPLVMSPVLEEALKLSSELGELPPELITFAMKGPLISATTPLWLSNLAASAGDKHSAMLLCRRARQIDARCDCLW